MFKKSDWVHCHAMYPLICWYLLHTLFQSSWGGSLTILLVGRYSCHWKMTMIVPDVRPSVSLGLTHWNDLHVFTRIRLATDHYSTMIVLLTHRILKVIITSNRYVKQSEFVSITNSLDSSALPTWISPQSNRAWSASNKFVRETSIAYHSTCYLGEARDQVCI